MHIEPLGLCHRNAWDRLVQRTPESGFMQSWAWSLFKEAEGQNVARLGLFEGDRLRAGTMIYYVLSSSGASALELPHGPVLPWRRPAEASALMSLLAPELRKLAEKTGSPLARIEPILESELPSFLPDSVRSPLDLIPTPTRVVPLNLTDEDLLAQMTPKGRYNIRLSLKKGVETFSSDHESAVDDFYFLFELTFRRHGFSGEPPAFFVNLLKSLKSRRMIRFYFARYRGMLVSSAVAVFFGRRATYLYGGNLPFLPHLMASYALHWQIMRDGRDRGCREYDLYGIAPSGDPHHPYARFSLFKSRFGGRIVNTTGARDIYFYSQLAKRWLEAFGTANHKEVVCGNSSI